MTLLLLILIPVLLLAHQFGISTALGIAGGLYGSHQEKIAADRMKEQRERAIRRQIKKWHKAYEMSKGQFEAARQDILGAHQAGLGSVAASAASSGLLGTTVAGNMARGVASDTSRALTGLASQRSASEYGKWMDLAQITGQTPYDNATLQPGAMAQGWGQFGAELGSMIGGFGGGGGGGPHQWWDTRSGATGETNSWSK